MNDLGDDALTLAEPVCYFNVRVTSQTSMDCHPSWSVIVPNLDILLTVAGGNGGNGHIQHIIFGLGNDGGRYGHARPQTRINGG